MNGPRGRGRPVRPIVIADDDAGNRVNITALWRSRGYSNTRACGNARDMMATVRKEGASLILLDLTMPPPSGLEILPELREEFPSIPTVVITGHNDVSTAVDCMKLGVYDYLVKAIEPARLIATVQHALATGHLEQENQALKRRLVNRQLDRPEDFEAIVFRSEAMLSVLLYLESISPGNLPVLITGETGTGKDLVARSVHLSSRRSGDFVAANVAGVDDAMLADTLFGHVPGAYTGAVNRRDGLVSRANEGTLFLDEIGDLSLQSQVKLLRLVENQEYYPLGSDSPKITNARIIVSTNRNLSAAIREGTFRRDLYYRLQTHSVGVPALRDRTDDINPLIARFVQDAASEFRRPPLQVHESFTDTLRRYDFPGNVRELRAIVFDCVSRTQTKWLTDDLLQDRVVRTVRFPGTALEPKDLVELPGRFPTLAEARLALIQLAMERAGGKQTAAARLLGISAPALNKELRKRAGPEV